MAPASSTAPARAPAPGDYMVIRKKAKKSSIVAPARARRETAGTSPGWAGLKLWFFGFDRLKPTEPHRFPDLPHSKGAIFMISSRWFVLAFTGAVLAAGLALRPAVADDIGKEFTCPVTGNTL